MCNFGLFIIILDFGVLNHFKGQFLFLISENLLHYQSYVFFNYIGIQKILKIVSHDLFLYLFKFFQFIEIAFKHTCINIKLKGDQKYTGYLKISLTTP